MLEKKLYSPKRTLSDQKAAKQLVELELIVQYNDHRHELLMRRAALQEQIRTAPPSTRSKLRQRLAKIKPAMTASKAVAMRAGKTAYFARRLRSMAQYIRRTGDFPPDNSGMGAKHATQFDDPEIKKELEAWKRRKIDGDQGGLVGRPNLDKMRTFVNKHLFPRLGIENEISPSTSFRWFKKLGYHGRKYKKGIYFDGHERVDVVKKRKEFIHYMDTAVLPCVNVGSFCMNHLTSIQVLH